MCICATWAYSLIWVSLQLGSRHGYVLEGFLTSCSFDYLSRDVYTRVFMMSMIAGGFLLPLVFLLTFLILTKRALDSYSKNFEIHFRNSLNRSTNILTASWRGEAKSSKQTENNTKTNKTETRVVKSSLDTGISFQKRQNKVIKTILLYVIAFSIAWTP